MSLFDSDERDDGRHAALVHTFALVTSATAAIRVLQAIRERQNGRDPSDQEAPLQAAAGLSESVRALTELLHPQVIVSAIAADEPNPDERVQFVRRFDQLHRALEAGSLMHRVHQRLLSLYPAVPAETIEEARVLQLELAASASVDGPDMAEETAQLLLRTHAFAARLDRLQHAFFSA